MGKYGLKNYSYCFGLFIGSIMKYYKLTNDNMNLKKVQDIFVNGLYKELINKTLNSPIMNFENPNLRPTLILVISEIQKGTQTSISDRAELEDFSNFIKNSFEA